MAINTDRQRRRSIRLRGYDYARAGAYFVTMVTHGRACLFGEVVDGEMRLNLFGRLVREEWFRSVEIRCEIRLHPAEFVVMPNHIHGIVWLTDTVGAHGRAPLLRGGPLRRAPRSLGSFVAGLKSSVTKRINTLQQAPGVPVWQRNYYEHVIRDEKSLRRVREYILNNPARWAFDEENPAVASGSSTATKR